MITAKAFTGKHYAVLGLARSGLATVEALLASGARVTAWDDRESARSSLLRSSGEGDHPQDGGGASSVGASAPPPPASPAVPLPTGSAGREERLTVEDFTSSDLSRFDSIVVTPGLPLNRHPIAQRAKDAGVEIIGDIELFARARAELPRHKVVGITGTNGKSTTTALVHQILQAAGVPSLMGGNIGLPILAQNPLPEWGVYILELSSYQLDLTKKLECDVAVLLNITPDHLERYGEFERYVAAKQHMFDMMWRSSTATAIIGVDDAPSRAIFDYVSCSEYPSFGLSVEQGPLDGGYWVHQGILYDDTIALENDRPIADLTCATALAGQHNWQNLAAAIIAVRYLGVAPDRAAGLLTRLKGLPHRMERIREKDGVLFVNDSKATNPTAAAPALAAFPKIRWICGGQAKTDNLDECAPHFVHVVKAYTIGEAGEMFASLLSPHMDVAECVTLEEAVRMAASEAESGDTVLLSPACASFDQFRDFEARGDAFRALVGEL